MTVLTEESITTEKATKAGHTGVMVAFMLPQKVASKLALSPKVLPEGTKPEPAEDLHIALAYLGQSTDLAHAKLAVIQCLADIARYSAPITGIISGVGLFNVGEGSDGKQPFYASFSSPALASFRQSLVEKLASHGVLSASTHGFTPHITLAYLPEGTPPPVKYLPALEITFDNLVLAWGGEQTCFPFPNSLKTEVLAYTDPVAALKEYLARTYKAGTQITGDLWRAPNGQFTSGSTGEEVTPAKDKKPEAREGGGKTQPHKDPKKEAQERANKILEGLIGSDMLEAMTFLADDPNVEIKPEYQAELIKRGLATKTASGKLELSPAAKALMQAAQHGDEKTAKRLAQEAAHSGASKPAMPSKPDPKIKKPAKGKPAPAPHATTGSGSEGGSNAVAKLIQRIAANQANRRAATKPKTTANRTSHAGGGRNQQVVSAKAFERNVGGGVDRDDLKTSDFIIPEERKFPVVIPKDIKDALVAWKNYKGQVNYEQFKARLTRLARRKGKDFVNTLPASWGIQLEQAKEISKPAELHQAFIETLKHGTHNQKTHGRRHLGGRVEELVKRGIGKVEARKIAAISVLNDSNASREERTAAKRIVPKADRPNLTLDRPNVKPTIRQGKAPATPRPKPATRATITRAFGSDPNRTYEFRNRIVDLDDLITSNNDNGTINPAYTQELQPRLREREASRRQVDKIAKTFVPESALWDFHQLDKGPAIIGPDNMVESGNGRTLAMRKMQQEYPEKWAEYQKKLRASLDQAGLTEADLRGIKNPVLVRERVSQVDRAAFAKEANSPPVLQMSALEQALVDSKMVSDASLDKFEVGEDQTIDQALRSPKNRGFVSNFVGMLSEPERAPLMRGDGSLSQQGLWRIKAALFTKLFPGEAGTRLADTFLESLDSTIKNFESGISSSMPKLARADALINSGRRDKGLSITEDLSKAIDMLARLKENGPEVKKYLQQSSMVERELTPFQESLLSYFDAIGRSPKKIKEFMQGYADAVINAQDLNQTSMFGDMGGGPTKESIVMRLIGRSVGEPALTMKALADNKNRGGGTNLAAGEGKRGVPQLKKKGAIPAADSLAAALHYTELAPRETLADIEAQQRLKEFLARTIKNAGSNPNQGQGQEQPENTFTVFKEATTGNYRWILRTSTAFQDRDGQIVSTQALKEAVARMDAKGSYGPLRWWHVPKADIGDCDFSMVVGKSLIESGTFRHPIFAEKFKGADLEASPGFHHPITEPDTAGVFRNIDIFERSLLPRGKASNLFTRLGVVAS